MRIAIEHISDKLDALSASRQETKDEGELLSLKTKLDQNSKLKGL